MVLVFDRIVQVLKLMENEELRSQSRPNIKLKSKHNNIVFDCGGVRLQRLNLM